MSEKYGIDQDPYCYPGSSTLINLLGIRDKEDLQHAERELTEMAIEKITFSEPPYDFLYFKNIHRILFSPIYEWAGALRTVDLSLGDTRFCTYSRIESEADKLFRALEENDYFIDLPKKSLIENAAAFYSDVNVLHPFRDGNGRAQRIFLSPPVSKCYPRCQLPVPYPDFPGSSPVPHFFINKIRAFCNQAMPGPASLRAGLLLACRETM